MEIRPDARYAGLTTPFHAPGTYGARPAAELQDLAGAAPAAVRSLNRTAEPGSDNDKKLSEIVDKVNVQMKELGKVMRIRYHEEAKQTYIEVIDLATQEVEVSYPPEFVLEMSVRMKDLVSLFLDKKL